VFACGIRFALADVVLLASVPRSVLILLSLSTCAVRVHSQSADMPGAVAEVSGCLRIVSIAASRRSRSAPIESATGCVIGPALPRDGGPRADPRTSPAFGLLREMKAAGGPALST